MGTSPSKKMHQKIVKPMSQLRIEIEREDAENIYSHIKSEIDDRKYRLYLLKCAHRQNEVITVKRDSYHETILKRIFNLL